MKKKTNLSLDFSIPTQVERVKFITEYLQSYPNPSAYDLTTMADYILWGKDEKSPTLPTDYGLSTSWTSTREISYEGLLESEGFNEFTFLKTPTPKKTQHFCLDRNYVRSIAASSPSLLEAFEDLWRRIDEADLMISYYEFDVSGKRNKLPRQDLITKFSGEEQQYFRAKAATLSQYQYLKMRKALLEMRRDQYTLKDSLVQTIPPAVTEEYSPSAEWDIDVLPLGLPSSLPQIWKKNPSPYDLSAEDLNKLTSLLWTKPEAAYIINFTDPIHVDKVIRHLEEIEEQNPKEDYIANEVIKGFIKLIDFYSSLLPPIAKDIYDLRKSHNSNEVIANEINKKYDKHYRDNYISTIYARDVVGGIAKAAAAHRNVCEELFFPENFKKCNTCGDWVLMDENHFTRRKRSSDGFYCHCKDCEKIKRKEVRSNAKEI